ncbi:MAG: HIT domain-containing protein [Candidatus Marinimicrobia bacterium]|nr:HIT domain-containing protein [Candidatus Neomarinimicrobiota bacterium]
MDRLWAPWRMEYIHAPKSSSDSCVFCENSIEGNNEEKLVVFRGKTSYVMLNLYPYNNGHLLVAPFDHESEFDNLTDPVQMEMMKLVSLSIKVLKSAIQAQGVNFGANFGNVAGAGIEDHLHFHLVPRWNGDVNFMPIIGHTKVMMDGMLETRNRLADGFQKLHL